MTRPRPSSPRAGRRSSPTCASPRSPSNRHVEGRRRPRHRSGVRRRQRGLSSGRAGGDRHRARRRLARRRHVGGELRLDELLQQDPARLPRSERRGNGGARRPLEGAGRRLAPPGRRHRLGGDLRWPRPARPGGGAPRRLGLPVERISPGHARELEPDLRIGDAVPHVVWTPGEGYVEAVPFVAALLAEAARRGARILPGRRVTGVIRSGARVQGVSVEGGDRLSAGVVVDCAGVATDEIARLAGVILPIGRVPGRLVYTAPVATTLRRPIHAPGCHFRPDGGGRIVLAEGEHDQVWAGAVEPRPPERSLATVAAHLPALAGARVEATRIGVRPMPRDERPMVGAIPGLDGFYVVASHSGVTLGPLWGRVATAEILDGAMNARLTPYRPARFL